MNIKRPDGPAFRELGQHDQDVVKAALKSGATRREVMGWLMASGATIGMAGSIVTSASDAIAATPKKGGVLRFAWDQHGPADTMDPILFTSSLDYARGRINYNSLTRFNEDLTVRPELATEWEANGNATEWTFKLRNDVEFHDGSKLTADDVIFTMNRHLGEESKSKAKVLVAAVKEWVKIDNHTVKAVLDKPNAELPVILGTFHFKILKDGTTDFTNPVGTGPFKLDEFKPGVRSVHTAFPGYWTDEGPWVERIEAFAITDSVARVNALISGDVQMIGNLDPKAIGQIEGADGVEAMSVPSGRFPAITMMCDREPGNNIDFRTGMKHLQRRDRVLKVIQKGMGTIGNDQPIGPAYGAGWCQEANEPNTFGYDPEKAKFHLDKSGVSGAEVHVAEVFPGMTDICLMLQRECQKIGFDLQIKKVPNDGYWGAVWMKQPMNVVNWNMRPSAHIMLTLTNRSDAPWNDARWKSERMDQLLDMSAGELDAAKRKEMMCEAQALCARESGNLIATHAAYLDAKATSVKGLPKVPLGALGGLEWPEYVWLDT